MIPVEAVEAAARASFDGSGFKHPTAVMREVEEARARAMLEAAAPYMHAHLLAELRARDEVIARVEAVAADLAERGDRIYDHFELHGNGSINSTRVVGRGAGYREGARLIRAAAATVRGEG